jgi:NAD-dependent dihydropyrimidine dehydrogenase PreA subunit
VVNTKGINVWCASDGGIFTERPVIDAIVVSELAAKVDHREVILPALAAPGVDLSALREHAGFHARFGPVYAVDIPTYLSGGMKKNDVMRRADFGVKHRLDMFLSMNFPIYLLIAIVLAIFFRSALFGFTIIFWGAVAFLYSFLDIIPGRTGWGQASLSAALVAIGWGCVDWVVHGTPFAHWRWLIAIFAIFFAAGFDIAGTLSARTSDAELLMARLGFNKLGNLFALKNVGTLHLNRDLCSGCRNCFELCPIGVFGELDEERKTTLPDRKSCFACGACIKQCPEDALYFLK